LIVMLGSNVLGPVVDLDPRSAQDSYGDLAVDKRLAAKARTTSGSRATSSKSGRLLSTLCTVKARHVVMSNVPG
jgi:hypothetical protein